MNTKKIKYGSNAILLSAILLAIILLVNFLSSRHFVRIDLTENKIYTISDSTKNVLRNLDDIVQIKVYFSKKPERINKIRGDVKDLIDEYAAFARGNLQTNFINPADDAELKQELRFLGIPEVQVNYRDKDKVEVTNAYMGIAILYGDKKEVIPIVENTSNLEYDLTSAVLKVTSDEVKTVGFLVGHGEIDIDNRQYERLKSELSKQYNVKSIELENGKPIGEEVSTLVIAGPEEELSDREKYEIDQFIMRGGRTIFMINPIKIDPQGLQANPVTTGLNELLGHYGAKLGNNLVLDRSNEMATFQQGFMSVTQPYPYFLKATGNGMSSESTITSQLKSLVLPWVSSVELTIDEADPIEGTELIRSSEFAWTAQSPYNLNPRGIERPPKSSREIETLAVNLSGKFKSFYDGKEIPKSSDDENSSVDRETKIESEPTQIVVIGTSQFLVQQRQDGRIFFLNVIDFLTLGEELIGIRSQKSVDRPLRETSESEKFLIKFLAVAGVPILVALFGISRYLMRRRAKQLVATYGNI